MSDLDHLFHPRSVAVVGIPTDPGKFGGGNWIKALLQLGFEGKIYPISRTKSECNGLRTYSSIEEVPDAVDLAVISLPARFTPQIMEQCVHKGVRFAQFFTAGFSEAEGDGSELEKEVVQIARKGGVRIIGPNCMGVYCPSSRFCWRTDFPREAGPVALLSQSGWNAAGIIRLGAVRGVRFSKLISYGNAADLNETDFLQYFADDKETKVVTAYIEGVKDGQRFFQAIKNAVQAKPVIVLKGGRSPAGTRAAASHTASLSGTGVIWRSLLRQAGAVEVGSIDELVDATLAFLCLPPIESGRVALIGCGGGMGVVGADECEEAGLTLPPLPEEAVKSLEQFIPREGTILRNPVDLPFGPYHKELQETISVVASCREIASLIVHFDIDSFLKFFGERELAKITDAIIAARRNCVKPLTVVLRANSYPEVVKAILEQQRLLMAVHIPVYPTIRQAAWAISRVLRYRQSSA